MDKFPKSVAENILLEHLRTYSHTIVDNTDRYEQIVKDAGESFWPYNLYVCPLCTDSYFYIGENKKLGNSEFSLDHLPPESVGGFFKVLTCKKCNNDAGHYEAELLRLVTFGSIPDKRRKSIIPYTYVINKKTGDRWPVRINKSDSVVDIVFDEKAKLYNEKLKKFLTELHNGEHPQLKIFFGSPDLDKIGRALLKSAYLICFAWWGYEFVFSKNAHLIRRVLNNELTYPTRVPTVWQPRRNEHDLLPPGVNILSKEDQRLAFVVTVPLQSSAENFHANVLIPGSTESGWQQLEELDKFVTADSLTAFDCMVLPRMISRIGYSAAWNVIS
ncbi:MAG: hypothetical protein JWM28_1041 [Chitinophagaceae bacterium]|nr:hypothetical protein [Chitinophagaceae bacterium]